MDLEVVNDFKPRYARNNKSKTKKNMRCFPHCSHAGHKEKGFCGSPIWIKMSLSPGEASSDEANYEVFGGIRCDEEEPWCTVGAKIDESQLLELESTKEVIRGTRMGVGTYPNHLVEDASTKAYEINSGLINSHTSTYVNNIFDTTYAPTNVAQPIHTFEHLHCATAMIHF